MFTEILSADEIARIEKDNAFYKLQEKILKAKKRLDISAPNYDFGSLFDLIKRLDWLKRIEIHVENNLTLSYEKQTRITANTVDFEQAKQLIYKEEEQRKELHLLSSKINNLINDLIRSRKGLPLLPITWENYSKKVVRADFELYFLSSLFQTKSEYLRPQFSQNDFTHLAQIYKSFVSPNSLIQAYAKFLGVDKNRIAIAVLNQRFNGFEFWVLNDGDLCKKLTNSQDIEYIEFDNSFVLKYENDKIENFVNCDIFNDVDVWVDPISLEIFVNKNFLPLQINRSIEYPRLNNIEYMPLVAFDYLEKAHLITISEIMENIHDLTPTVVVSDIYVLSNNRFHLIPEDQSEIWTFANIVIFSLSEEHTNGHYAYIFNVTDNTFTKFEHRADFNFSDLFKMVSDTLEFLRIPGFELHSPDKLIEDLDNQLYS